MGKIGMILKGGVCGFIMAWGVSTFWQQIPEVRCEMWVTPKALETNFLNAESMSWAPKETVAFDRWIRIESTDCGRFLHSQNPLAEAHPTFHPSKPNDWIQLSQSRRAI